MQIYLLRHGQTAWNAARRYQGNQDIPLSAEGRAALRRADFSPARVYVSPLMRARQTAAVLFPQAEQIVVPDLREMNFGSYEGRPYINIEEDAEFLAWEQKMRPATTRTGSAGRIFAAEAVRPLRALWRRRWPARSLCLQSWRTAAPRRP